IFHVTGVQTCALPILSFYRPCQYLPETDRIVFYHSDKNSITITTTPMQQWIENNRSSDTTSPWLEDYNQRKAEEARIDSILKARSEERRVEKECKSQW